MALLSLAYTVPESDTPKGVPDEGAKLPRSGLVQQFHPAELALRIGWILAFGPGGRLMAGIKVESISPSFAVRDLSDALRYYQEVLGFDVAWTWGEPPDLASVCRDAVSITLAQRPDAQPSGQARVYLQVTGIDDYYTQLEHAGANIVVAIGDRPYGMRDFGVADPFGNHLDIGEPIAPA